MTKKIITGAFPPVVTPFTTDGDVDFAAFQENIAKYNETGLAGYVIFGSNGEYAYLDKKEKLDLVKAGVEAAAQDKLVIVGSGCEGTRETIELTNECARLGADAALILTPNYYKDRMTKEVLKKHFLTVADHADIPIMLYSVPKFTGVTITPDLAGELSQHPNIIGIKDSAGDVTQLALHVKMTGPDFSVLVGTANVLYPGLAMGAKGGIMALANCCPRECVRMYQLYQEGKFDELRDLQCRLIPVNTAVTGTYGIAGLKLAMDMLGFKGGAVRMPLLPLSRQEKEGLVKILETAQLL